MRIFIRKYGKYVISTYYHLLSSPDTLFEMTDFMETEDPTNQFLIEDTFPRSFFRNTQKTFENTEKKKFGFLMVIKTLKLEGKILFLTYILHLS